MFKLTCTGRLGRDPEKRTAASGEPFVTFSVAVQSGFGKNAKTEWIDVSCNGKTADVVMQYCRKGQEVLLEGTPSINTYTNKEGVTISTFRMFTSTVEMIGSSKQTQEGGFTSNTPQSFTPAPTQATPALDASTQAFTRGSVPPTFNAPGPVLRPDDIPF